MCWVLVVSSIDVGGSYPNAAEGPGLSFDEPFNVSEGVRVVHGLEAASLGLFDLTQIFGEYDDIGPDSATQYHNPDHPPLGRIWIGIFHNIVSTMFPPTDHETAFVVTAARTAPATAFALTVFLIGCFTTWRHGRLAGTTASISLVLMPRLFGHAHLASLESFIGLMYAASVLSVAYWWNEKPPRIHLAFFTGMIWGLALLTKIQAILIPIAVFGWAVYRWRLKSIVPLIVWGVAGGVVFFTLWPWLWIDPFDHVMKYLGRTSDRIVIRAWFFGQQYADREVPFHFPLTMFLTTVPIGLHALGFLGLARNNNDEHEKTKSSHCDWLILVSIAFPMLLFSIPGVTVYDGARLFLMVFPLWAIFVGRGADVFVSWVTQRWSKQRARILLAVLLAAQSVGLVTSWPCHLSYYNMLVGSSYGAERLGIESTYWGDSLTRSFLQSIVDSVPEGSEIEFNPVMHQFYLPELTKQSPILRKHGIRLVPFSGPSADHTRFVLVIRRRADLPPSLRETPAGVRVLAEHRKMGVVLAALYECPADVEL